MLGIILYSSLIYQINVAVSSRQLAISVCYKKKIEKFLGRQHKQEQPYTETKFRKHIVIITPHFLCLMSSILCYHMFWILIFHQELMRI